jgi:hypothetical protein
VSESAREYPARHNSAPSREKQCRRGPQHCRPGAPWSGAQQLRLWQSKHSDNFAKIYEPGPCMARGVCW